ncbi:MMPL family transporter [Corynebacterium sp. 4HC-13]|nr:MMPL family transporter [Corynebacterium anserum]
MKAFRWLALIFILLAGAAIGIGAAAKPDVPAATLPDGTDSKVVAEVLAQRPGDDTQAAIVFFTSVKEGGTLPLNELRGVAKELGGPLIPNGDKSAAIIPIEVVDEGLQASSDKILSMREDIADQIPAGVESYITGPAAVNADLSAVFSGANFLLLGVTAVIVAVLLIVTYRSPILWVIPLLVIGVADRLAQTVFTWILDALGQAWNESVSGILSVLVFGAGTNYALLLISRYRDELHRHESRFDAMAAAWKPTVKTISTSALTVVLGVVCLMLSAVPTTRGLGLGSVVGVLIALFFGAFVLPGTLVFFGRWIFWPRKPKLGDQSEHVVWDRVGREVRKRPAAVAIVSLILLAVCCVGAVNSHTGLTQSDQFIKTPESIAAADMLGEKFPGQDATPANVITKDAKGLGSYLTKKGAQVQPAESAGDWEVLNVSGPDTSELRGWIAESGNYTDAKVGGQNAELYDQEQSSAEDRALIFPLVLVLVFVALMFALRSLVAPAIMVASVLLTNIAALGLGWWISTDVFGFKAFADTTPLYAFVFLVALGVDYSIFLITRAREEAQNCGTGNGILRALSSTGGVITSAGILLAAVFAALGVLPLVVLAQVGIVIFIGVLLDTLIVRTLLIPAVVQLMGEKFWWPNPMSRNEIKKDLRR